MVRWPSLVASLSGDEETTAELRPRLSVPDATAAGMFMVSAPGRCAQELAQ